MGKAEFIENIRNQGVKFLINEPMSRHTTFKIGGPADIFISVQNTDELTFCITAAKAQNVPYFICGKGSDLLVSDGGVEGAVISLTEMRDVNIDGTAVTVEAGQSVQALCIALQKAGLSGFEFAYGIPGTVGGAVYMNAGAYGGETADRIISVKYLDTSGGIKEITKENANFSYRNSVFQQNGGIILSAKFEFCRGDSAEILQKMNDYLARRKAKQPLEFPSAGSVFRRPEGNFAGTLIEKSGLKGARSGGAVVSDKHAGFIVNIGGATCKDVKNLIEKIREKVFADSGVKLQPEVICIGR